MLCAAFFFERFVLFFCLKIERFVPETTEIWICGLYKGDNISAPAMDNNDLMKEVDVYDLSGRMVRRQVRKSEALRGLHKGIYIMDGKKYVVK